MNRSEIINDLAAALSKAQAEFSPIGKSKTVKFNATQYKYADLADMIKATTPALSKYGLSITQELQPSGNELLLETTLMHASGQWRTGVYPVSRCAKPQDQGSQITYARKYALQAALNIAADEDDDGQIASGNLGEPEHQKKVVNHPVDRSTAAVATPAEIRALYDATKAAGYDKAWLMRECQKSFETSDPTKLTTAEVNEVLNFLVGEPKLV